MVPDPIAHSPLRPASRRPRDQADARPKEKIRLIKVDQQTHTHTRTHAHTHPRTRNEEDNASSPAPGRLAFAIDLISLARSPGRPSCAPPEPAIDRDHGREEHADQSPRKRNHCIAGGGKGGLLAMVSANGGGSSGSSEANSATASGPDLTMRTPPASAVENKASAPSLEFFNELEDSPMFKQQAVDLEQGSCRRRRRHNSYPIGYPPR